MRFFRLIAVTLSASLAACSSSPTYGANGGGGGGPGANEVWMQNTAFNPASRTVAVHTVVVWTNQDAIGHTVTKSSGPGPTFDSGTIAGGGTYSVRFDSTGTYEYYCRIHGSPGAGMHATIVVQ